MMEFIKYYNIRTNSKVSKETASGSNESEKISLKLWIRVQVRPHIGGISTHFVDLLPIPKAIHLTEAQPSPKIELQRFATFVVGSWWLQPGSFYLSLCN